ncbi:MAG TPA: gliding motility-associated C-terminal domain-containing protein [Brumimicrobium sp.]|nr:gliding motility-associated C-terminal domain-containing protein [Brumimicrobium sp.]
MKLKLLVLYLLATTPIGLFSQVLYSNGGLIHVSNGGLLYSNGGIVLTNSSSVINEGSIVITKNTSLPEAGNFAINTNTIVAGNGSYRVQQDWINDATFNANNSEVELFGNTEQIITSNNGTNTVFNRLVLTGNGVGVNRRKSLLNVNASINFTGELVLNNRELNTNTNIFKVDNPNPLSILFDNTYNNEGFVSSLPNGFLIREMNQADFYLFPLGSSNGTRRFRPVAIESFSTENQSYAVRMNNFLADLEGYPLTQKQEKISEANAMFYHSARRISGSSNADFMVFYDPTTDNNWESIAHWSTGNQIWEDVEDANINSFSNYKYALKNNWSFPSDNDEYVLINSTYKLEIPNVFTPNGDNINDGFYVTSSGLEEFNIQILNRWGNLVFESDDVNEIWNGRNLSQNECTDGVYFYVIKAKYKDNEIKEHGHITLLRK